MKKVFFILLGVSIAILFISILLLNSARKQSSVTDTPTPTQDVSNKKLSIFKSSNIMTFEIVLPSNFQAQENLGSCTIISNKGNIYIEKNGTNFSSLNDYINDLDKKNGTILEKKQNININGLPAILGYRGLSKNYYIYTSGLVYLIFTDKEVLFSDLDQIAQSFRYTP